MKLYVRPLLIIQSKRDLQWNLEAESEVVQNLQGFGTFGFLPINQVLYARSRWLTEVSDKQPIFMVLCNLSF